MRKRVRVAVGDQVFASESGEAFGTVRVVHASDLVVFVEAYGDVTIRPKNVAAVHDGKVIVDPATLSNDLRNAIGHAHDLEAY